MSSIIIPQTLSKQRPRRARCNPAQFNPLRRLAAAVAAQAVLDVVYPELSLPTIHKKSAFQFILSDDGQYILSQFVNPERVKHLVARIEQ